jgi:hypothetical protein
MGFLTDLMGGSHDTKTESSSVSNDQRAAVGERGMLVRDNGSLSITDGGSTRAALKAGTANLGRVLDFATTNNDGAIGFGRDALAALVGLKGQEGETQKWLLLAAVAAVGLVGFAAVNRKG